MKAFSLFLGAGVMLAASAFAAETTWTGRISDSMCGASHSKMEHGGKKTSAHDCTIACVKGGAKYVFVSKGRVFEIQNHMKALEEHAGHTVKLTGELASDGKTITASKIEMPRAKKS